MDDINDFESTRLLFDASHLSFRSVVGPFCCMGKLSFRPRSYQIVPLVMALSRAPDMGRGLTGRMGDYYFSGLLNRKLKENFITCLNY